MVDVGDAGVGALLPGLGVVVAVGAGGDDLRGVARQEGEGTARESKTWSEVCPVMPVPVKGDW